MCLNNGTCNETEGSAVCVCADGYTVYIFLLVVTVCDMKPCKNGGRCVVKPTSATGYVCVCATCGCLSSPAITATCDIDKATICNGVTRDTWHLAPFPYDCHKFVNCTGGSFVAVEIVSNNYVYNPANGVATVPDGLPCAKLIEPEICSDNTCQNNGKCNDTQTGFRCNCTFGFIGLKCEYETEKCTITTCKNYRSCTDMATGVDCACPSRYGGSRCEKELQFCNKVSCQKVNLHRQHRHRVQMCLSAWRHWSIMRDR
ncbi:hypothetical protein NP493_194g01000 [Ridgeia piscesae]|uniref:EGF-like domain-containing protein n=1 Tax=Ridgeia piscesae TaxID=27915 RepID=A0AAD9P1R2_RIDPI|nr:hypothetical protein NP493_194g01000 [Ridgeia piscesae]